MLHDVDRLDRIKYCKPDFERVVLHIQKSNLAISDTLTILIIDINKQYFDEVGYQRILYYILPGPISYGVLPPPPGEVLGSPRYSPARNLHVVASNRDGPYRIGLQGMAKVIHSGCGVEDSLC